MTDDRTIIQPNAPLLASNDNEFLICTLFVEDDRYSVPTLSIVPVADVARARALAERALRASPHHLRAEARREDELLFVLRRDEID